MSDGGVLAALRSMGYDGDTMSGHEPPSSDLKFFFDVRSGAAS